MKFDRPSKEKRRQLILVTSGTLGLLAALGWGLLRPQYEDLGRTRARKAPLEAKLDQIRHATMGASQLKADLAQAEAALATAETDTASGDLYASTITTLCRFKANYHVAMTRFGHISRETDVTLLPNFPYKQVTLTVAGTARFRELGKFLAGFENHFPHVRVVNLAIDQIPNPAPDQPEAISFQMDIVTLVRPNA
jgi:hypothetical protein